MEKDPEIALIMANSVPLEGRNILWTFSRNQIEFILREIVLTPAATGNSDIQHAHYQDEALPLLDLEAHFGLETSGQTLPDRYIVVKTTNSKGEISKLILRTKHTVRMKKLSFSTTQKGSEGIQDNRDDILGTFLQQDGDLLIVPDLSAILKKLKTS